MIRMKNVCAGYQGAQVLHDISLEFEAGKVTVLIGPNGCGKSTLLKTMVNLKGHDHGEIWIDEEQIEMLSSGELAKRVAYLPQNKRTPDIRVFRMVLHGRFAYLKYPRRYRAEDYEVARNAMKWVGIEHLEEKSVSELSGGNQQKVYIAMALAQDTDTILLDEPTTFLDVAHQLKMMELARELANQGKAVVMVLHDLAQAFQTADKIIVMNEGRIKACGDPEEVFQSKIIEEVFDVQFHRTWIDEKWRYFFV